MTLALGLQSFWVYSNRMSEGEDTEMSEQTEAAYQILRHDSETGWGRPVGQPRSADEAAAGIAARRERLEPGSSVWFTMRKVD